MPTALENYRKQFRENQLKTPPAQEGRALRAVILTEIGQTHGRLARSVELMKWPGGRNPEPIIRAWQDAVGYFHGAAETDRQTGQRRPLPPYAFCDGSLCQTLDEAERGLAAAQRKIVQIEQARRDLAAANARLVELTGILAELDAETAAA